MSDLNCKYCDNKLFYLPSVVNNKELFCTKCNCSYYYYNDILQSIKFDFHLDSYYFTVRFTIQENSTFILGTFHGLNSDHKKQFVKSFDYLVNISPQNAKDKIRLYMMLL